jgi:hypothetical protein
MKSNSSSSSAVSGTAIMAKYEDPMEEQKMIMLTYYQVDFSQVAKECKIVSKGAA